MKKFCRILSIIALIAIFITSVILVVKVIRKPANKEVYATSVSFKTLAEAVEIYSENKIVITDEMVTIKPSNCTIAPEFLFKKYGQSGETAITDDVLKFESEGRFILICRVKSGDMYYVEDRLIIDVKHDPRETTSFYIQRLNITNLYIDENVSLNQIAYIKKSANSVVDVICDENVKYENGILIPLNEGKCQIVVVLMDNNVAICQEISINIKSSIINAEVELRLTLGGEVLDTNVIEKEYSQFNFDIGYKLINIDRNQAIDCWTEGGVVEVIKYNSPTITLKPLNKGTAVVYVKPLERPDLTFEIVVIIN